MNVRFRRFKEVDAEEVRNIIVRNFLEVNSKDYGIEAMQFLANLTDALREGAGHIGMTY